MVFYVQGGQESNLPLGVLETLTPPWDMPP